MSTLSASKQVKVQTACTVAQGRDRCRVPGPEWNAQNVKEHSRMGRGGVGVGMTFLGFPHSYPGTHHKS